MPDRVIMMLDVTTLEAELIVDCLVTVKRLHGEWNKRGKTHKGEIDRCCFRSDASAALGGTRAF